MTAVGLGLAALGRPGLHQPRPRRRPRRGPQRRRRCERAPTRCSTHAYAARRALLRRGALLRPGRGVPRRLAAQPRRRAGVTVGSKWGYTYTADWRIDAAAHEVKDLSAATLRRQLAETREHLGERLRLYQIHSATIESGVLEDAEVLDELAALRATGVAIGLTATGPRPGGDDRPRGRRPAPSTRCRRRGTCTSAPPARRSQRAHDAGLRRDRQGGGRQRAAEPSAAAPPALAAAAARARRRRPTRSRSRPRSRSRGPTSCSAARRRRRCSTATSRRSRYVDAELDERARGPRRAGSRLLEPSAQRCDLELTPSPRRPDRPAPAVTRSWGSPRCPR